MSKRITKQLIEQKPQLEKKHENFEYITKKEGNKTIITQQFSNNKLSIEDQRKAYYNNIAQATGSTSFNFGSLILSQTIAASFLNEGHDAAFISKANHDALLSMKPADEFEGMLCTKLIALHNQSMNFMNRLTSPNISNEVIDMNINRSVKLQRLYNETLDALMKYRRKGEQKVTVQHQHVQVNEGGQAIVGQVGGRVNSKK